MASDNKKSPELLSKVALQISEYFKKAYDYSQMNRAIKAFDRGRFAGILEYHDKYFEGSAWLVLGINRFQVAKDQGKDMGIAAGTANHAAQLFAKMEGIVRTIPQDYADNYNKKREQANNMATMSADKAKKVFFEQIPDFKSIKMPDQKNFVKFDASIASQLNEVPVMNEILRHVIPPQVRNMQGEFKQQMQNMIDQAYKNQEKSDLDQRSFLG